MPLLQVRLGKIQYPRPQCYSFDVFPKNRKNECGGARPKRIVAWPRFPGRFQPRGEPERYSVDFLAKSAANATAFQKGGEIMIRNRRKMRFRSRTSSQIVFTFKNLALKITCESWARLPNRLIKRPHYFALKVVTNACDAAYALKFSDQKRQNPKDPPAKRITDQ